MNTEVSLLHAAYSPDLRDFVEEKLSGLTRFHERLRSVRAVLDCQREEHMVELVAKVDGDAPFVVEQKAGSARAAVDLGAERLARVLRKAREKSVDPRRR
ncbi:MAG: HPF/RaiA family ribosome-associated protein [Planctomycetes bacterium]|nr:HPF/RaiA family ribosome-associated protein [Planctomycetota bacterium]